MKNVSNDIDKSSSPWLGLASYDENDVSLFYGRAKEIEELYFNITHNTLTVIFGPSGTGKTSIIKAGIFGKAKEEAIFFPVYVRLNHDIAAPSYSSQIIQEIEVRAKHIRQIFEPIGKDEITLWEYLHINLFFNREEPKIIPLIVIDQFEELFTIAKKNEKIADFFEQLADVCNNRMSAKIYKHLNEQKKRKEYLNGINYRIVLSLREDFLARLQEKSNDIPSITQNLYSLQALNEEQAYEIITKPGDELVTHDVAIKIIGKVTDNHNFTIDDKPELVVEPAILSVFCNELYNKMIKEGDEAITDKLIEEAGGNIIADFYEKSMSSVSSKTADYLESNGILLTADGYRNSISVSDALAQGVTSDEITELVNNRLIRQYEWGETKRIEFIHDVVCRAAKKRKEKEKYRRLQEELLKRKRRNRVLIATLCLVLLTIAGVAYGICYAFIWEYSEYYTDVVKKNGWPTGIGKKLSKKERKTEHYYYKLSRTGRWGSNRNFKKMEIYHIFGKQATLRDASNYLRLKNESGFYITSFLWSACREVSCWEYLPGASGGVEQEIAYAPDGSFLYKCTFNPVKEEDEALRKITGSKIKKNVVWGVFTDEYGFPLKIYDNIDRMKIFYNHDYEVQHLYYNKDGVPQRCGNGAFGKQWINKKNEKVDSICWLINTFGEIMKGTEGYCSLHYEYDSLLRWKSIRYYTNEERIPRYSEKQYANQTITMLEYRHIIHDDIPFKTIQQYNKNSHSHKVVIHQSDTIRLSIETVINQDSIVTSYDPPLGIYYNLYTYYYNNENNIVEKQTESSREIIIKMEFINHYDKIKHYYNYHYNYPSSCSYYFYIYEIINFEPDLKSIIAKYDKYGNLTFKSYKSTPITSSKYYGPTPERITYECAYDKTGKLLKEEKVIKNFQDSVSISQYTKYYHDNNGRDTLRYTFENTGYTCDTSWLVKKYDHKGMLIGQKCMSNNEYANCHNIYQFDLMIDPIDSIIYTETTSKNEVFYAYDYKRDEIHINKEGKAQVFDMFGNVSEISHCYSHKFAYKFAPFCTKNYFDFYGRMYRKSYNEFNEPTHLCIKEEKMSSYLAFNNDRYPIMEIYQDTCYIIFNEDTLSCNINDLLEINPKIAYDYDFDGQGIKVITSRKGCGDILMGDVLVALGEWKFSFEYSNFDKFSSVRNNIEIGECDPVEVTVVRHDPITQTSKRLVVEVPKNFFTIITGNYTHYNSLKRIYYTEKEKERLQKILDEPEK